MKVDYEKLKGLLFAWKMEFHVGFFIITKWSGMVLLQSTKYLSAYLSVMISLCSTDKGSRIMVHFFCSFGATFFSNASNLGTDILYILKNLGGK